jgi:hypothetical protein
MALVPRVEFPKCRTDAVHRRLSQHVFSAIHGKLLFEERHGTREMLELAVRYSNFPSCQRAHEDDNLKASVVVVPLFSRSQSSLYLTFSSY